jgi:hypothetical protein
VTLAHDANLTRYHEEWKIRFAEGSDPNGVLSPRLRFIALLLTPPSIDRGSAFRCTLLPLYVTSAFILIVTISF